MKISYSYYEMFTLILILLYCVHLRFLFLSFSLLLRVRWIPNTFKVSDLEGMTSRPFTQSLGRHYMLTTSPFTFTPTASCRLLRIHLPSNPTIRTFAVSRKNKLEHNQKRAQSRISKAFPEAMQAIKQTVAENIGIGVSTFSTPQ